MNPRVSILTVCYNSEKNISATLQSVARQTYENIEHIIQDGGSTDETLSLISQAQHQVSCVSEPDSGIYNALNKALDRATGDIVCLLHSDDVFASDNTVEQVVHHMYAEESDWLYGNVVFKNGDKIMRKWRAGAFAEKNIALGWMPPHTSVFLRATEQITQLRYREDMRISADYDYLIKLMKMGLAAAYMDQDIVHMQTGGASTTSQNLRLKLREDLEVLRSNGLPFSAIWQKRIRKLGQLFVKIS